MLDRIKPYVKMDGDRIILLAVIAFCYLMMAFGQLPEVDPCESVSSTWTTTVIEGHCFIVVVNNPRHGRISIRLDKFDFQEAP